MANLQQILVRRFPGAHSRAQITTAQGVELTDAEMYPTIVWLGAPVLLADIQAQRASVEAEIATEQQRINERKAFENTTLDAYLLAIEILTDFSVQLGQQLRANALNNPLVTTRLAALRAKLAAIRAQ